MKISELIKELENVKKEHGDIPIVRREEYGRHSEYGHPDIYSARDFLKRKYKVRLNDKKEPSLLNGQAYIEV